MTPPTTTRVLVNSRGEMFEPWEVDHDPDTGIGVQLTAEDWDRPLDEVEFTWESDHYDRYDLDDPVFGLTAADLITLSITHPTLIAILVTWGKATKR